MKTDTGFIAVETDKIYAPVTNKLYSEKAYGSQKLEYEVQTPNMCTLLILYIIPKFPTLWLCFHFVSMHKTYIQPHIQRNSNLTNSSSKPLSY